jgi:hypothetical protein
MADPFHVVRAANGCVDMVRRRVQNETLGHLGRKADSLYDPSSSSGCERLDERGHERVHCSGCAGTTPTTNSSGYLA